MKIRWKNPKAKVWTNEVYLKNLIVEAKYWGDEDQSNYDSRGIGGNWEGDEIPKT